MSEPAKEQDTSPRDAAASGTADDAPSETASRQHTPEESIKDTFESIIIAFVLAFVFRAYVVEAFVIPTGSMAPTLLGQHYDVVCGECGYRYATESNGGQPAQSVCQMCRFPNQISQSAMVRSGDRILVHKFIYSIVEPKRWDVVVFKNPQEPHVNFIKRLVGLPGEDLRIIEGNVYVKQITEDDTLWRIARKSDRPRVQRDVWQPLYHSQYIPLDGGEPSMNRRGRVHGIMYDWEVPWKPEDGPRDAWEIDARSSYRYNAANPGSIVFDFSGVRKGTQSLYAYNYFGPTGEIEPVEDIRLAACMVADQDGAVVRMETTARLDDPEHADQPMRITAVIDAAGRVALETDEEYGSTPRTGGTRVLAETRIDPLPTAAPHELEFWFVDQHASVWIDGEQVLTWAFDLPIDVIKSRRPLRRDPTVRIAVEGSPLTLHRVEVDRDIYYSVRRGDGIRDARGGLVKGGDFGLTIDSGPVRILNDRFFCMGDNSPHSHDSRYWDDVDNWVQQRLFDPSEDPLGMVPRKLMMGRAFYVYLPAPFAPSADSHAFIPNFGDMRFIH